jgi:uncharacterized protein with HEPN domain
MTKDDRIYVGHMLDLARSAVAHVDGVDRAAFDENEILRLALVHLIQTIGEAAARVSDDFRRTHAEVPRREIVGMRHKIVHDYIHVDFDIVWGVATSRLPTLIEQLEQIVPE